MFLGYLCTVAVLPLWWKSTNSNCNKLCHRFISMVYTTGSLQNWMIMLTTFYAFDIFTFVNSLHSHLTFFMVWQTRYLEVVWSPLWNQASFSVFLGDNTKHLFFLWKLYLVLFFFPFFICFSFLQRPWTRIMMCILSIQKCKKEINTQFHWHFLITSSGFWLVNFLLRKFDTLSNKVK